MTPSRRQFVASIAVVPFLPQAALGAQAQVQSPTDPVLDDIVSQFEELRREGDEKPAQRKGVIRAAETLTGVLAAHLGQHHDPELKRALRRGIQRRGRQALVQELTATLNKPEMTHERVDAMLTRLDRDGMRGILLDGQKTLKRIRENAPDQIALASSTTMQYDFCADLNWIIQIAEMAALLACMLAVDFLGLNPAADAACAAAQAALLMYLAMKMWYGC
jgi:hypothetical protein